MTVTWVVMVMVLLYYNDKSAGQNLHAYVPPHAPLACTRALGNIYVFCSGQRTTATPIFMNMWGRANYQRPLIVLCSGTIVYAESLKCVEASDGETPQDLDTPSGAAANSAALCTRLESSGPFVKWDTLNPQPLSSQNRTSIPKQDIVKVVRRLVIPRPYTRW